MKKNLLADMQSVEITDKDGETLSLSIEIRKGENGTYMFLADSNQMGLSRLAQDAVFIFEQVCTQLALEQDGITFFRHIYQDQMGSLFGRYSVDWAGESGPSYKFQMLTNIDDLHGVQALLDATAKIDVEGLAA